MNTPRTAGLLILLACLALHGCGQHTPANPGTDDHAHDHDDHDHDHSDHDHDHEGDHSHADDDHDHEHGEDDHHDHDHSHVDHAEGGGQPVAIPPAVRSNLGITFVRAESRRVEQTRRVPGRFEYPPTASREYRTPLPGRVELLVNQFQRVEAGDPLYRVDSPQWRETQQRLAEAESDIDRLTVKLRTYGPLIEAHERHAESLTESVDVWQQRIDQLELVREAGGGRLDELVGARASLGAARAELADVQERDAEIHAGQEQAEADLRAARARLGYLTQAAEAVAGQQTGQQAGQHTGDDAEAPDDWWRQTGPIEVRATRSGVIASIGITNGAWADERTTVLTIVRPEDLRFRASGLQSDLANLRDGLMARIVPPASSGRGNAVQMTDVMWGHLTIGLLGDPDARTIDLFVTPEILLPWARAGVSAHLEIITDPAAEPAPAIPLAAVQRDGLTPVIFKRSPADPDTAIRVEPVLGTDDGRWVTIRAGVSPGDEIVLDGAFQLMLASSGSIQQGGHFHADGTFHDEAHGEEEED